jgi:hypothetical protein
MINKTSAVKPWYREPWPWILMAGPAIVVVAGVITAYLAIVSNDGLVADDYYKQGLAVNQVAARNQYAEQFGLQADVVRGNDENSLRVFLRGKEGFVFPSALNLRITHPTRSGVDQSVLLRAEGAGFYSGQLSAPLTGRWHVALEDEKREWRLTGDWIVEKQPVLQLPSVASAHGAIDRHADHGRK